MPKVSVIIPVFNTERFLRKCLDSVCNQTLSDIEIICVNDASQDNSLEILKEYSSKDKRIKIINFTENRGVSVARNAGMAASSGEYLGFVDSDDYISVDFYECLYKRGVQTNSDAVKGKIKIVSERPNYIKDVLYDINDDVKKDFSYFYHSFASAIYNADFVKNNKIYFPEGINNFEDPFFSITAGFYYTKVEIVSNVYYYYRERVDSISNLVEESQIEALLLSISVIYKRLNYMNVRKKHYAVVAAFLFKILKTYIFNGVLSEGINLNAINLFSDMVLSCKYKNDVVQSYIYLSRKEENKLYQKKLFCELTDSIKGKIK